MFDLASPQMTVLLFVLIASFFITFKTVFYQSYQELLISDQSCMTFSLIRLGRNILVTMALLGFLHTVSFMFSQWYLNDKLAHVKDKSEYDKKEYKFYTELARMFFFIFHTAGLIVIAEDLPIMNWHLGSFSTSNQVYFSSDYPCKAYSELLHDFYDIGFSYFLFLAFW